jgi:MFS family permease
MTEVAIGEARDVSETGADERPKSLRKTVAGACAGALMEYYDFSIYASLTIYLSLNFFPPDNPAVAVLLAVSSMGVAFVFRPLGGIVFGALADRIGRRKIFIATLLLMSFATIGVGVLPGYAMLGIAAPIILVGLRICQGLAVGGEYAAASTYVVEHSPRAKRGYYAGWLASMASSAIVLSLLVVSATQMSMSREAFEQWGWRVPFLLAIVLLGFSLMLRRKLRESPVFADLERTGRKAASPLRSAFGSRAAVRDLFAASIGICSPQITSGVVGSMLALYFLQTKTPVDPATANLLIAGGCLTAIPSTVFAGWLSDRVGRKTIQLSGMALGIVFYIPLFQALVASYESTALSLVIIAGLQVPSSLIVGAAFSAVPEIFPAERRTTSVALSFSLGGIVGGLAPAASLWLAERGGLVWGAAWPVTILVVGAAVNLLWVPNRTGANID